MSRIVHDFADPDRFVVGTIGEPGERAFFLQATRATVTVTLSLEKQHAKALGESIDKMLDDISATHPDLGLPPSARELDDTDPLEMPVDPEFPLGAIALNWMPDKSVVVVDLVSAAGGQITDEALLDETNQDHDVVRIQLTPYAARQFSLRCKKVVEAGRKQCPLCQELLTRKPHMCIRLNGYKQRTAAQIASLID